jgi:hypothetical protein
MTDPAVLAAVSSGAHGAIGVAYVEWAGAAFQRLLVPWTRIAEQADAAAWAARLADPPVVSAIDIVAAGDKFIAGTSIARGIDFSVATFTEAPWDAERRVIDVSGDGVENSGGTAFVEAMRDGAVQKGITVNGLAIEGDPDAQRDLGPGARLSDYYRASVVGGPGAFVIEVDGFGAFREAVRRKLVREIAAPAPVSALA